MEYEAMLATNLKHEKLADYIIDDDWWFEQKLDGIRLGVVIDNGNIQAWNRRGNKVLIDPEITNVFARFPGQWVFDGEHIGGVFWVFDLPVALDKVGHSTPYESRRVALEAIAPRLEAETDLIHLLPTHRTKAEKAQLIFECRDNNSEGIMVKHKNGLYFPDRRSPQMLKAKFVETIDCIVTEVGRLGKRSIAVAVYDEGTLVDVGACTVTERMLTKLQVGDIVELKYLYGTQDNRIYQPSFLRIRTDKRATDCTLDQLKIGDKTVLSR